MLSFLYLCTAISYVEKIQLHTIVLITLNVISCFRIIYDNFRCVTPARIFLRQWYTCANYWRTSRKAARPWYPWGFSWISTDIWRISIAAASVAKPSAPIPWTTWQRPSRRLARSIWRRKLAAVSSQRRKRYRLVVAFLSSGWIKYPTWRDVTGYSSFCFIGV